MKILMLSDVYFPRVNGVSTSIATCRAELEARGHEVHLLAPDYEGRLTADETRIRRIPARRIPFDPEDRLMRRAAIDARCDEIRAIDFDLVHIQTPFVAHYAGLALARELGIPCVETYHTYFEEYFHHYLPLLPASLTRYLARRFSRHQCDELDALIVPSPEMLETLRRYGTTVRAEVIPTGLPKTDYRLGDGDAFRAAHGIARERPVLLYVGRVAFEKNIDFLLRVTARVRDTHPDVLLLVAGEGPALPGLKRQAAALGLGDAVQFLGYLDRLTELPDCYRAANVFVFSSRTETQGLVLLEAMAQGVPVVALAEMGTRDVLREGSGALIASERVDDFAARVGALLDAPHEALALGERGRRYVAQWTAEALTSRLIDCYRSVVERHAEVPTRAPHCALPGVAEPEGSAVE